MLVAVAGLLFCACRGNDASSPAETTAVRSRETSRRIDAIAEGALRDGPVAGLSIAVFLGSEPFLVKGYGFSDVEAQMSGRH